MRTWCAARSDHVETWVSLRFGHVRVLTPHRGVIHYPRAASLPYGLRGLSVYCITKFFTAVSESTLRMTAGGCVAVGINKDTHKTKTLTCHPERTKYAKFCVGEKPQSGASGAKPRNGATRSDDGIYERLPIAFPRANELFRMHKRQRKTRVCANILRREIRPSFVGSPYGLHKVTSFPCSG